MKNGDSFSLAVRREKDGVAETSDLGGKSEIYGAMRLWEAVQMISMHAIQLQMLAVRVYGQRMNAKET